MATNTTTVEVDSGFKHNIHFFEPVTPKFWRACAAEFMAMCKYLLMVLDLLSIKNCSIFCLHMLWLCHGNT